MSRPFKNNSGKNTFAVANGPLDSGEYIHRKKARASYCVANGCVPAVKVGSQSNKLLFDQSNRLYFYPCKNNINKSQLYINLYTKLDLSDSIPVIADLSGNVFPVDIDISLVPYLKYQIDPDGYLFGNNTCGINNYLNYLVYNPPTNLVPNT